MKRILWTIIIMLISVSFALADGCYLIIVDGVGGDSQTRLEGYPGRAFGKLTDRVYLFGQQDEINWLKNHGIDSRQVPYDREPYMLYLCYGISEDDYDGIIYDSGAGYIVTDSKIPEASFCRKLKLRRLPFTAPSPGALTDIQEYNATIDSLINEVSQDSLIDLLTRLTGEAPIEIDGEIDTIHTRYSGTEGNQLAAQYIYDILENYGYQVEYHSFYDSGLRNIAISDANTAWTVAYEGDALRMTDGTNWQDMEIYAVTFMWGIENWGPDSLWVVGDLGTIRFSDNGGDTWSTQNSGTSEYIFGCLFVDSQRGWIAGDNGLVRRTQNGGLTWLSQSTPNNSCLYDICFVDATNGWAVGREGTIIHTSNGGQSWALQTSNTGERLYSVNFTDADNGWAVGWSGVVRHTTDGGVNWQAVDLGGNNDFYHVDFTDTNHGCIVGTGGTIYVTFDSGDNWGLAETPTRRDLYALEFASENIGYAGGDGIILVTYDGGLTWYNRNDYIEGVWQNVIATKTGTTSPDEQVIICGHFDNRSEISETRAPGADDNGSGTMAVLEAARLFANSGFERTIKYCLWTGEEQGLLGSAAFAEDAYARGDNIVGVFNFDMIAWDGNNDEVGELHCGTTTASIELGDIVETVIADYGLFLMTQFITWGSTDRSDHASFWDYNFAAMLGIEDFDDFNPYYHSTGDNMSHIVADYFTTYVKASTGAVATLAIPDTLVTSVDDKTPLPENYFMASSYPNPFNASVVISFNLPRRTKAHLAVYDILGREVTVVADRVFDAGKHNAIWRADRFSSGLYFYRLQADGRKVTGSMVLLK